MTAAGETRTLYLHHTHTGETGRFTFKRDGRYDQSVLREINRFLADWRNKKQIEMDPALLDLIWTVYQEVGASQPINIVSSYRSPETNRMLAAKSSGVADNSQHMKGKAIDFFIPGISLKLLRETAMRHQVGGVGYYPTSGSPFVHLDTGSVRAWPRMTTAQLKKVFPDGRTLHIPADGRVLSQEGRQYAEAEWNKCHMVPCNGAIPRTDNSLDEAPIPATPGRNLMDVIFGNDADSIAVASVEAPTQRTVTLIDVTAPVPLNRPGTMAAAAPDAVPFGAPSEPLDVAALDPNAPMPLQKSAALLAVTGGEAVAPGLPPSANGETALVALANLGAPTPKARVLMTAPATESSPMVTAYVPTITPDPGAQRALEMIIERETTATLPAPRPATLEDAQVQTASLGEPGTLGALQGMLENTWDAVSSVTQPHVATALISRSAASGNASFGAAPVALIAPDIEHVSEVMVEPVAFSSRHFSELYEAEGYLDKTTELGSLVTQLEFEPDLPVRAYDRFDPSPLIVVALR